MCLFVKLAKPGQFEKQSFQFQTPRDVIILEWNLELEGDVKSSENFKLDLDRISVYGSGMNIWLSRAHMGLIVSRTFLNRGSETTPQNRVVFFFFFIYDCIFNFINFKIIDILNKMWKTLLQFFV